MGMLHFSNGFEAQARKPAMLLQCYAFTHYTSCIIRLDMKLHEKETLFPLTNSSDYRRITLHIYSEPTAGMLIKKTWMLTEHSHMMICHYFGNLIFVCVLGSTDAVFCNLFFFQFSLQFNTHLPWYYW